MAGRTKISAMADYDFGPEWFWRLFGLLAIVGVIAVIVWAIKAVIWLLNHVTIN